MAKIAYIDEAGTSQQEPVVVVVGAIIDADKQAIEIEEYIENLKEKYIPAEDRETLIFHAKDLFHGSGYFDREKWPLNVRMNIYKDLLSIFPKFYIPLSISFVKDPEGKNTTDMKHSLSYLLCISRIEEFMQKECSNKELAILIAEDGASAKKRIRNAHEIFLDKNDEMMNNQFKSLLPIRHIRDSVYFAGKKDCKLLQVADIYAFAIRRLLSGKEHSFVEEFLGKQIAEHLSSKSPFGHELVFLRPLK